MNRIYATMEELIGKTPLLRLDRYGASEGLSATIYAKLEAYNPAGSAKDRVALSMILDAEEKGLLRPGAVIIEPTSGNTGIGLCAVAAARGYRAVIVMPDTMSRERIALMRAYGAEVVLTDGKLGMAGAIAHAEELARATEGSFLPRQFENPANAAAHYRATGPEIEEALGGKVDAFVAGVGTGGTITGVGEYLKEKIPTVQVVGVEPASSAVLLGGKAGSHGLQGIGAGFIPAVLHPEVIDEVVPVTEAEAYAAARRFVGTEGLLCGISGGAALVAATTLARREEFSGKNIVVLLPDSGERYLSTDLYGEG